VVLIIRNTKVKVISELAPNVKIGALKLFVLYLIAQFNILTMIFVVKVFTISVSYPSSGLIARRAI
jgi:hypothetical protein